MEATAPKTLLLVDAHLEFRSPSMQHVLHSLPALKAAGWEIEAWCLRSDAPRDAVRHVLLPIPKWLQPLDLLYFNVVVNLYGLWRTFFDARPKASVIHASCGTYLGANLVSVHFINTLWASMHCRLGFSSLKDFCKFLLGLQGIAFEWLSWWSPALRKILAVSDSIAGEIRVMAPARVPVEVLPYSYDESRFEIGVRTQWRQPMRLQLGLDAGDFVFVFASQGHHRRKGFWLALEALQRLRRKGLRHLRFLVVGGTPQTLAELKSRLAVECPDWEQWVLLAGMQPQVEKYFAAADAFLFPSLFETYALVAMEAALLGLPLLLTPFHGSEMTLRDGVNGVLLSFEPERMSQQIELFLKDGLPPFPPGPGRALTRAEYGARLVSIYEDLRTGGRTP